jgi:signal transduction histidine kinase
VPALDLAPIAIVGLVALILAITVFISLRNHFEALERERFKREAAYYGAVFTGEVKRHVDSLAAFRAFVSATRGVTRWAFSDFAGETLPRNPGFASILWVPAVAQKERARYETQFDKDGLYGLRIREAGSGGAFEVAQPRPFYFPVSYIEPFQEHGTIIGVNLGVDPLFQQLFDRARAAGHVAASPPVEHSLLDPQGKATVVIAYPLMTPTPEAAADGPVLQGYALGALSLDRLLRSAAAQAAPTVVAAIGYNEPAFARRILYSTAGFSSHRIEDWLSEGEFGQSMEFTVAGEHFVLALRSAPVPASNAHFLGPLGAALLVLAIAGLLCQHLYSTQAAKRMIELAVKTRTAALHSTNKMLEEEVTQRRQAEEDLRAARDKAESVSRAKSEFLATMSHELRTPLNAIIGFSSLLAKSEGASAVEQGEFVKQIHEGGIRLLGLINELLEISQMDAGRIQLEEDQLHLPDLVADVLNKLRGPAAVGQIELRADFPANLPLLLADERRLQKAIAHLVSNAIKFTPAGGFAEISIRQEADRTLSICVTDNGVGIPKGQEARILEPFVQLDSTLARSHGGAGLGLAYIKRIADLHEARLSIVSGAGKGTRVTLTFPARRVVRTSEVA